MDPRLKLMTLAFLMTAPAALAAHTPIGRCDSDGSPALGIVEISGGSAETTFYIDDRFLPRNGFWIYLETNGIWTGDDPEHDVQRGGVSPFIPDDPEICTDDPSVTPDVFIF